MQTIGALYSLNALNKKIMNQVRELAEAMPQRYCPLPETYKSFYPPFSLENDETGLLVLDKVSFTESIEFEFDDVTVLYCYEVLAWASEIFDELPKLKKRTSYQEIYLVLLIRHLKKMMKKEKDDYHVYFK